MRYRRTITSNRQASRSYSSNSRFMITTHDKAPYELVDFASIPGVPCPCGTARRGLADVEDYPGTIHVTDIALDNALHYHKQLTETYYFLECESGAQMQLGDEVLDV